MRECNVKENLTKCTCTYEPCNRKGVCCECIHYHLENNQVPACLFAKFSKAAEKTYDRSIENFITIYKQR